VRVRFFAGDKEALKMKNKKISNFVIGRLPRYYRMFNELKAEGVGRVSSFKIAEILGVTASQVRQDFANFGDFGQQGYGYEVSFLTEQIRGILGLNNKCNMIVLGGGHIGRALAAYNGFRKEGFFVRAVFDKDLGNVKSIDEGIETFHIDELEKYIAANKVDIAIITTQKEAAKELALRATKAGVKNIWNFAPVDLRLSPDIIVENINMSESLFKLAYKINHKDN
jgi:redox-sensing transcriptional repressor